MKLVLTEKYCSREYTGSKIAESRVCKYSHAKVQGCPNVKLLTKYLHWFALPPALDESSHVGLYIHQHLLLSNFYICASSLSRICFRSLVADEVEHLFMCLGDICASLFLLVLFVSFAHLFFSFFFLTPTVGQIHFLAVLCHFNVLHADVIPGLWLVCISLGCLLITEGYF